jgi:hypothetical protein
VLGSRHILTSEFRSDVSEMVASLIDSTLICLVVSYLINDNVSLYIVKHAVSVTLERSIALPVSKK